MLFDNMGTNKIYRDDFDEQFALACRRYGDNIWDKPCTQTSVRGIL